MTVNSPVPMASYQDGPRSVSGTIDAADDGSGYQWTLTVVGPGSVTFEFRDSMSYAAGYRWKCDGSHVTLTRIGGSTLASAAAGYGTYTLISKGSSFTVKRSDGSVLFTATDSAVPSGLRTRYTVSGGAKVTTLGQKL